MDHLGGGWSELPRARAKSRGAAGARCPKCAGPPRLVARRRQTAERALHGPREHPGDLLRSWHPGRQGLVGWLPQVCGVAVKEKSGLEDSSIVSAC